jgi:hypothetical protein
MQISYGRDHPLHFYLTALSGTTPTTKSMNGEPKDDQPKPPVLYALGAAAIAVLLVYAASHWWT